jgi:hypothetical protein
MAEPVHVEQVALALHEGVTDSLVLFRNDGWRTPPGHEMRFLTKAMVLSAPTSPDRVARQDHDLLEDARVADRSGNPRSVPRSACG